MNDPGFHAGDALWRFTRADGRSFDGAGHTAAEALKEAGSRNAWPSLADLAEPFVVAGPIRREGPTYKVPSARRGRTAKRPAGAAPVGRMVGPERGARP